MSEQEKRYREVLAAGEAVARDEAFADDYIAQAIPMTIVANGGEAEEAVIIHVCSTIAALAAFLQESKADPGVIRQEIARTLVAGLPYPDDVVARLVENYIADEDEIIAEFEKQLEN